MAGAVHEQEGSIAENVQGCAYEPGNHITQPGAPALASALRVPAGTKGLLVADVVPHSPAAAAGLRRGDVIVEAGGQHVADPARSRGLVHTRTIGARLLLVVLRDGHTRYVTATIGQMPSGA